MKQEFLTGLKGFAAGSDVRQRTNTSASQFDHVTSPGMYNHDMNFIFPRITVNAVDSLKNSIPTNASGPHDTLTG